VKHGGNLSQVTPKHGVQECLIFNTPSMLPPTPWYHGVMWVKGHHYTGAFVCAVTHCSSVYSSPSWYATTPGVSTARGFCMSSGAMRPGVPNLQQQRQRVAGCQSHSNAVCGAGCKPCAWQALAALLGCQAVVSTRLLSLLLLLLPTCWSCLRMLVCSCRNTAGCE
jgi:hypothetical protein